MKSYIKLYGPSVMKGLRALEKVAAEMPECSFWHAAMPMTLSYMGYDDSAHDEFFARWGYTGAQRERLHRMISKSGHTLGDYDFFFEWHTDPTWEQIQTLIEKTDEALKDTGCTYTITTK